MRARLLSPDFFTDEKVVQLSPLARLLFQGMWCLADREGRIEEKPVMIKLKVLPADDADVVALLQELADAGLVVRYESEGKACLFLPGFFKHQRPHVREAPSKLPAPSRTTAEAPAKKANLGDAQHQPRSPVRDQDQDPESETVTDQDQDQKEDPAPKKSWHFKVLDEMYRERAEKMRSAGMAEKPDEPLDPEQITSCLKRIRAACGDDQVALVELWYAYLDLDWPAKMTPPYPFRVFASAKTWRPLLDKRRAA